MIDGRLAVPAAAAWAGAVLVTIAVQVDPLPSQRYRLALIAAGVAIAVATAIGLRFAHNLALGLLIALGLGLGGASAGLQVAALTADPVADWVERRATVTLTGVVTTDPVIRTRSAAAIWQPSRTAEIRLATSTGAARGTGARVEVPVRVRLPVEASIPPPGSSVTVTGRLAPSRQPDTAAILIADNAILVNAPPGPLDAAANAMRAGLRQSVSGASPDAAALVAGLAVGDESLQSSALDDAMRASGLSHLTAVSGGNVAIILVVVLAATRFMRLRLPARIVIALAALACFVVLVRPQPSVVRAAAMGVVMVIALASGGRRTGPSVLATAVLVLVIIAPLLTVTWAFALSVFATGGLILLAPWLLERLQRVQLTARWPSAVTEGLAITLAAQLATAPLLITMGAAVGWAAIPANLLAMPAVAPVTVLGLIAALVSPIVPVLAVPIAQVAAWPAGWIAAVAHASSRLPMATMPWPSGIVGLLALVAAAFLGMAVHRGLRRRFPQGVPRGVTVGVVGAVVLAIAMLVIAPPRLRGWPPPGWHLVACDVGQGDGLVARAGPDAAIVIDVGPDPRAMRECLEDLGIRRVGAVILTHFHADHVDGLPALLDHVDVGEVTVTAVADPPEEAAYVNALLAERGMTVQIARVGDVRRFGEVTWQVLWPRRVITRGSIPNNASVVMRLDIAGTTVLLPGDIEAEAQAAVMAAAPGMRVHVMKVPHHGSRNQHPRLPAWSGARVALISCGAGNRYGHPHPDTLRAWEAVGALIGRTDIGGDLAVVRTAEGALGLVARGPG